jgi:hypothetical protein
LLTVGCPQRNYHMTQLLVSFDNVIKPSQAWMFPTDAQEPTKRIQLAIAIAKPCYAALLGNRIQVRAETLCRFFPRAGDE